MSFRDVNFRVLLRQREEERKSSIVLRTVVLQGVIEVVSLFLPLQAPVIVGIARHRLQDEEVPQGGTGAARAQEIVISIPIDRDHTHVQDRGHALCHPGLGVGLRCDGIEGWDGGSRHRPRRGEEGGGGGALAIQVSPATVIAVAAEVEAGMGGVEANRCTYSRGYWVICTA